MKDLGIIQDIRNKFVHNFKRKFADKTICKLVGKLSTVKVKAIENNSYALYGSAIYECLDKINDIEKKLKEVNS